MSDEDFQLEKEDEPNSSSIGFISSKSKIIISLSLVGFFIIALIVVILIVTLEAEEIPKDMDHSRFVIINDLIPDIITELRYYSSFNFVGEHIDGYQEPVALLTKEAAEKLKNASDFFDKNGYRIKIWDSYRPQAAVDHFVRWNGTDDEKMKDYFFPNFTKKRLFAEGFIQSKSGHSRGSTLDLTLIHKKNGTDVDFGTSFDYFGIKSNTNYSDISEEQKENRKFLKTIMEENSFINLPEEWWHYTLKNEPFPDTYFNFPVNATLIRRGIDR